MGRPKKQSTPKDAIGQIFATNVEARLAAAFPKAKNETERFELLGKRSGVGKETIRAAMRGERSPTLVTLDAIARALGTSSAALLDVPTKLAVVSPFPKAPPRSNEHD
jgi:transcriptional regulator with XRE-family HTH domain